MVLVVVPAVLAAPMFILAMCAPVSVRRGVAFTMLAVCFGLAWCLRVPWPLSVYRHACCGMIGVDRRKRKQEKETNMGAVIVLTILATLV